MNRMYALKSQLLAIVICFISFVTLQAQDPVFSQFFAMPTQLNPAFAGNTIAPRFAISYRNQWLWGGSPTTVYETYAASYGQFFEPINSSIGFMVQSDNAGEGVFRSSSISGIYGYRLQINKELFLKMGIEASLMQSRLDWNQLIFLDQIDPVEGAILGSEEAPGDNLSRVYGSVSAGFLMYAKDFYVGFGAKHLNSPNESLLASENSLKVGLPMRFALQAGGQITLREGNSRQIGSFFSPNVTLVRQADLMQLNAGGYIGYGAFFGGVWFRHGFTNPDAAIFLIGAEYDIFRIGYSYDFTVSRLAASNGGSGGASEITLILNFENGSSFKKRRRSSMYNDCLKIFR